MLSLFNYIYIYIYIRTCQQYPSGYKIHTRSVENQNILSTTAKEGNMTTDLYSKPTDKHQYFSPSSCNPFWDSKPELFSDIACLRIPYQPCIVLFVNLFSGTPASNRHELRLQLNVVPTGQYCADVSAGCPLFHEGIIRPVISVLLILCRCLC